MRFFITGLILISVVTVPVVALQAPSHPTAPLPAQAANLTGRWRVKFSLTGIGEKNLVFDSQTKGSGSFLLLDAGTDEKAVASPLPAVWSQTTNDRVNFAGEVELPLGTCCREIGTLIFKGKFKSRDSISGKAIFIASTENEDNFNGYTSTVGTFTAARMLDNE
ncbi:MAG TPA: hypothetical protein VGJ48_01485 [Pyrinomonadaceae bacterium]|jgi:hypothetical protein